MPGADVQYNYRHGEGASRQICLPLRYFSIRTLFKGGFAMEKRFKVLRFVGSFYKVVGIIIGVLTIFRPWGSALRASWEEAPWQAPCKA